MESLITQLSALHLGGWAGYGLIALFIFGESLAFVGFAVPGSLAVVFAGALAAQGIYDFWILFLIACVAAILGNTASYELGRRGKHYLKRHPWMWKHVEKGQEFFGRHGGKSVFVGHFLGPVRHAVPVAAGAADMDRTRFHIANIPGAALWALTHLAIGYIFGSLWRTALLWTTRAAILLVILAILIAVIVWLWRWFVLHGEAFLELLSAVWRAVKVTVAEYPPLKAWMKRHERPLTFLRSRFSRRSFFGLPFTIFSVAFVYTASLLFGIVQDYLESDPLIAADKRIENLLFAFRSPILVHLFYFITLFGQASVIGIAVLLTIALWGCRQKIFIFTLWLTLIGAEGTAYIGKILFHRQRPEAFIRAVVENSFSFPSGHSTTAAAFYGFLAYLLVRTQRSWKVKVSAIFSAALIILLVNVSRLYLGVHYLSDVLAGDLVSLSFLIFAISVTEWLLWGQKDGVRIFSLRPLLLVVGAQLCIVILLYAFVPAPWSNAEEPKKERIAVDAALPLFRSATLPSYTETLTGSHQEPVNVIMLVPKDCLVPAMQQAAWMQAQTVSLGSLLRTFRAILLNQPYPSAPMTPSFYNARPHDLGFEKATEKDSVRERHHARFWETRYETASGSLFVGTVSLDTGVKWAGITHAINPDIDTERRLLVSDLQSSGFIRSVQEVSFVQPTLGQNFTGDPFFTDGKADFLQLRGCEKSAPR